MSSRTLVRITSKPPAARSALFLMKKNCPFATASDGRELFIARRRGTVVIHVHCSKGWINRSESERAICAGYGERKSSFVLERIESMDESASKRKRTSASTVTMYSKRAEVSPCESAHGFPIQPCGSGSASMSDILDRLLIAS